MSEKFDLNLEVSGTSGSIANNKKSNARKDAFNVVTLLLIFGLISSLLIPERIHKPPEHGVTTHI